MRRRGRVRLALWLVAVASGGCATPRSWARNDLCLARRVAAVEKPPADSWLALLLEGYDAPTRRATIPALDCTGARVVWTAPAQACTYGDAARTEPPAGPIAPGDVLSYSVGHKLWLTWVITGRYASGDALGVVALVEASSQGERDERLVVRALGPLRAYPRKAKLRLQPMGSQDLLVAEGERCVDGGGPCSKAVRLVPLREGRFVPVQAGRQVRLSDETRLLQVRGPHQVRLRSGHRIAEGGPEPRGERDK